MVGALAEMAAWCRVESGDLCTAVRTIDVRRPDLPMSALTILDRNVMHDGVPDISPRTSDLIAVLSATTADASKSSLIILRSLINRKGQEHAPQAACGR